MCYVWCLVLRENFSFFGIAAQKMVKYKHPCSLSHWLGPKRKRGEKKSACLSVLFYPRLVWMASSLFNTANSLILYKVTLNHALFEMKKNRTTWMAKWENCWVYFQNGYIISSSGSIRQHDQLMPLVKIHLKTVEMCKPPRGHTQNCLFKRNDLN